MIDSEPVTAPLVVVGDDTDVFESVTIAEKYIEAPEVRSGQLHGYDYKCRPLKFVVAKRLLGETVKCELSSVIANIDAVRQILEEFLAVRGEVGNTAQNIPLPIEALWTKALKYATR